MKLIIRQGNFSLITDTKNFGIWNEIGRNLKGKFMKKLGIDDINYYLVGMLIPSDSSWNKRYDVKRTQYRARTKGEAKEKFTDNYPDARKVKAFDSIKDADKYADLLKEECKFRNDQMKDS